MKCTVSCRANNGAGHGIPSYECSVPTLHLSQEHSLLLAEVCASYRLHPFLAPAIWAEPITQLKRICYQNFHVPRTKKSRYPTQNTRSVCSAPCSPAKRRFAASAIARSYSPVITKTSGVLALRSDTIYCVYAGSEVCTPDADNISKYQIDESCLTLTSASSEGSRSFIRFHSTRTKLRSREEE